MPDKEKEVVEAVPLDETDEKSVDDLSAASEKPADVESEVDVQGTSVPTSKDDESKEPSTAEAEGMLLQYYCTHE